jgi:hypothetical protein
MLRAAADRLLAGTLLHSSGKLTILDLAEEAQIKRWLLTHKYPTTLMAKYQAEFKAARHKSGPVKKTEAELDKLREELVRVRKRQLSELVGTYAVMIEQLARERAEALAERDAALAARDAALGVTSLPTTPPQQRAVPTGGRTAARFRRGGCGDEPPRRQGAPPNGWDWRFAWRVVRRLPLGCGGMRGGVRRPPHGDGCGRTRVEPYSRHGRVCAYPSSEYGLRPGFCTRAHRPELQPWCP